MDLVDLKVQDTLTGLDESIVDYLAAGEEESISCMFLIPEDYTG